MHIALLTRPTGLADANGHVPMYQQEEVLSVRCSKTDENSQRVELGNVHYRIVLDLRAGTGEIFHRIAGGVEMLLGRVRYLAASLNHKAGAAAPMEVVGYRRDEGDNRHSLEIECLQPDMLRVKIALSCADDAPDITVSVVAESVAECPQEVGLRSFCVDLACDTIRARLLPGLYSGWTCKGRSLLMFPIRHSGAARQMTLNCDFVPVAAGDIRTAKQGMALNLPAGMFGGTATLDPGEVWRGGMILQLGDADIWNPALAATAHEYSVPESGIQPARHSYETHLSNWEHLMRRDDVWVSLGPEMGMYHRGFFNMINSGQAQVSGPLRYEGYKSLGTGPEKLIELAWGGSNNSLLAYTLFQMGAPWAQERARQIMEAVPGVGFQIQDGPCRAAWHNGYLPETQRFADRYGRDTLYTPDQGIANYFLGKTLLDGLHESTPLIEAIRANCFDHLLNLKNGEGGLEMARRFDGSPGVDRYGLIYDGHKSDLALPAAMGALSFLMCHRLTGESRALAEGEKLLRHTLEKVEANEWRFHEYDTWGWDNMASSWILVALCEWAKELDGDERLAQAIEKTLLAILSCQHQVDFRCDEYSDLERCWGGRMINRGGFIHSTTVGSLQGGNYLHNRFDPALALWTHYQLTGDSRSYTALLEFLNYLTYHQWTRRDLSMGRGAVSECMHFEEGHVQDSAQTLHSNCLHHILLQRGLFLESSTARVTHVELPNPNGPGKALKFGLEATLGSTHRVAIGGCGARALTLRARADVVHVGDGRDIIVSLSKTDGRTRFTAEPVMRTSHD